jgi:hypothetical protein
VGFNNCYIPNYNQLVEYYSSVDLETFVKRFRKYDSWSGDSDAMNFLENKYFLPCPIIDLYQAHHTSGRT